MDEQIEKSIVRARTAFGTGRTQSVEFRVQQLHALNRCIEENRELWISAVAMDIKKPRSEIATAEISFTQMSIKEQLLQINEYMKPKPVFKSILMNQKAFVLHEPYGVVLIISPWNFPIQLAVLPLVGAIAAGNCVILKPSEISPRTSRTLAELLPKYLDRECYHIIEGDAQVSQLLLEQRFDYIFFTGSTKVGHIVAQAAAKYLTPVTLELGGKSPVFIDETVPDMMLVCKRVLWGKFMNTGQLCIAPDYLLCTPQVQTSFIECARKVIEEYFGDIPKTSKDFGRIVNEMHFKRVSNLIKSSGRIAIGGDTDAQQNYIEPTILVDVSPDDPIMCEEIFGPVLPIVNVSSADEAIEFIRRGDKPLALYVFTDDEKVTQRFLTNTSSGGVCVNDTVLHTTVNDLPFGGVGPSGMGRYHGIASFTTFSNSKSVLVRVNKSITDYLESFMRYPPLSERKQRIMDHVLNTLNYYMLPYHWRNLRKYTLVALLILAVTHLYFNPTNR